MVEPQSQFSLIKSNELIHYVQTLVFSQESEKAVQVLESHYDKCCSGAILVQSIELSRWYGIALMSAGILEKAKSILLACLALGDHSSTGPLAATQRLMGESTDWLLLLPNVSCKGFERAFWEKEVACVYWKRENYKEALSWLEQAWKNAHESAYGYGIYAAIAQPLGQCLRFLGRDADAIRILDVALKYPHSVRRAKLLIERALANFQLMRLEKLEEDLNELKTLTGKHDPFVQFLEGCLHQGRGDLSSALEVFQVAREFAHAANEDELIFFANLFASQARIEQEVFQGFVDGQSEFNVGADNFIWQAEEVCVGKRQYSWMLLNQALLNTRKGNIYEAKQAAHRVFEEFKSENMLREAVFSSFIIIENCLREGDFEVKPIFDKAAKIIMKIGNSSGLIMPLRLLPLTREYISALPADSELRAILSEPNAYKELMVFKTHLEIDGERIRTKRSKTVELIRFMAGFEQGATLEEIISQFFLGYDRTTAKPLFHILRKDVADSVPSLSISLDPLHGRYTLTRTQLRINVK